jgi:tetratricopeptide (TPR) repeat protein
LVWALAQIARGQRNFARATRYLEDIAKIFIKSDEKSLLSRVYYELGTIAQEKNDLEAAHRFFSLGKEIARQADSTIGLALNCLSLGAISLERRDLSAAEAYLQEAWKIVEWPDEEINKAIANREPESLERLECLVMVYHNLGLLEQLRGVSCQEEHQKRDHLARAEHLYLRSRAIAEPLGLEEGVAKSSNQSGVVEELLGNLGAEEGWYPKSLALKRKLGDERGAAATLRNLGLISLRRLRFDEARNRFIEALTIYEKINDEHGVAMTSDALGALALDQGDYEEAGAWFLKALLGFSRDRDHGRSSRSKAHFLSAYSRASDDVKARLRAKWNEAGLGPFPAIPGSPASQGSDSSGVDVPRGD